MAYTSNENIGKVNFINGAIVNSLNPLKSEPYKIIGKPKLLKVEINMQSEILYLDKLKNNGAHIEKEILVKKKYELEHNFFRRFSMPYSNIRFYHIKSHRYEKYCTYKIYKDNLASYYKLHNISLNYQDALIDTGSCGELSRMYLNK